MPDFFDHLWQQMSNPRSSRDRLQYLGRLKALIAESPPARPLPRSSQTQVLKLLPTDTLPDEEHRLWAFDRQLGSQIDPRFIRQAKERCSTSYFVRLDPLEDEAQILETRAMGGDSYVLDLSLLDTASTQYLIEVGIDYSCDALVLCRKEEDLARALTVHKQAHILLVSKMANPSLLDLPQLRGRKLWVDLRGTAWPLQAFHKPSEVDLVLIPKQNSSQDIGANQ